MEAAHESDTVAGADLVQDMRYLEDLIEGLNSADPSLKLKSYALDVPGHPSALLDSPFVEHLRVGLGTGDAWRAIVDSGNHRVAMSIQCSKGSNDASILVVDASPAKNDSSKRFLSKKWFDIMSAVAKCVGETLKSPAGPPRLHTTFTCSGAQKSPLGCAIFSLSATRKMASDPHIAALHARTLDGLATRDITPGLTWVEANEHLPPSFFKHATSEKTIKAYVEARRRDHATAPNPTADRVPPWRRDFGGPDEPVNKQGETLLKRYESNEVVRYDSRSEKEVTYSNSYEAKRIEMIKTALAELTAKKR